MLITVEHSFRKFVVVRFIRVVHKMMSSLCDQCFCVTATLQIAQGFASSLQTATVGHVRENFVECVDGRAIKWERLQSFYAESSWLRSHTHIAHRQQDCARSAD